MIDTGNIEKRIKRHVLGKTRSFFISTLPGIEQVCFDELSRLGVPMTDALISNGGISFLDVLSYFLLPERLREPVVDLHSLLQVGALVDGLPVLLLSEIPPLDPVALLVDRHVQVLALGAVNRGGRRKVIPAALTVEQDIVVGDAVGFLVR